MQRSARFTPCATALTLAALLAGCGASTDSETPPAPPPVPPSGVTDVKFTAPASADNVVDAGTSVSLQVRVKVDGSPVADGVSVAFSTSAGSLAPPVQRTAGGAAATLLQGVPVGPVQVQAAVGSAKDSLALYVRPEPVALQMLVPAFFKGGTGSPWSTLISGSASYPAVNITAIANPHNGVLTSATVADTSLPADITSLKAVAGSANKVVGYVSTGQGAGTRSLADVQATIDKYLELYPKLDGFFLGEMAATGERLAFYQDLHTYIKNKNAALLVLGNPGTFPDPAYAGTADVLVTFEGNASAYRSVNPQPANTWVYAKPNSAQAMLVHGASSCVGMQAAITQAGAATGNTGWVYVTDLSHSQGSGTGSPWSALPSYWTRLLGTVDAINSGRALPAC